MNARQVLVTGATGFIGSAVLRALAARPGVAARGLVRRAPGGDSARFVLGDLTEPASLEAACRGVHTVVHAASEVGEDPRRCWAVNAAGTAALVAAAHRAGVARIVHVSTASVYGRGPHCGAPPPAAGYRPSSAASRSRLVAERVVRDHGGVVVRPHLVHGRGDRWFVPALAGLLVAAGARIDSPALVSTILVDDLARAVCALAALEDDRPHRGTALDVNHPEPTSVRALGEAVAGALAPDVPDRSAPLAAFERLLPEGGRHRRHLAVLAHDRWYESRRVWDVTGLDPGAPFEVGLERCADWYRHFLRARW